MLSVTRIVLKLVILRHGSVHLDVSISGGSSARILVVSLCKKDHRTRRVNRSIAPDRCHLLAMNLPAELLSLFDPALFR
jgi:hypothetical protein